MQAHEHQNETQQQFDFEHELADLTDWVFADRVLMPRAMQARRLVYHLLENGESITTDCCIAAAAVNLSDVAAKNNGTLYRAGLFLSCRLPDNPILNRFGEKSNQYLWRVVRLPNAEFLRQQSANQESITQKKSPE